MDYRKLHLLQQTDRVQDISSGGLLFRMLLISRLQLQVFHHHIVVPIFMWASREYRDRSFILMILALIVLLMVRGSDHQMQILSVSQGEIFIQTFILSTILAVK